jgi:hypothetical protein
VSVAGQDGDELAGFAITGLDAETALVAVEVYRRQGTWKVRAVGQGYADEFSVHVTDPADTAVSSLAPLVDSGALADPPAAGAHGVSATPAQLTQRVDLVTMALRGGFAPARSGHHGATADRSMTSRTASTTVRSPNCVTSPTRARRPASIC